MLNEKHDLNVRKLNNHIKRCIVEKYIQVSKKLFSGIKN